MKILILITTAYVPYGGLATVVMNYYRALDKSGLSVDIASTNAAPEALTEELGANGSNYYCLGKRANVISYVRNLWKVLRNNYDIVHTHGNSATMALELFPAKLRGVPVRIAHVHTTRTNHPVLNRLVYPAFQSAYNKAVAVSKDAGDWLFGSDYLVLNNAISVSRYSYREEVRNRIRAQLNISGETFVVGNIGKLNFPKNHAYLFRVFAHVKAKIADSKLIIVGGGELEGDLLKLRADLKLENDIILTGMLDDASEYLQAFDFFAFPSRFEGLGLSLIEAQASGLRCAISDEVPEEAIVTNQVRIMGIDERDEQYRQWADYIVANRNYDRQANADAAAQSIRQHGYDIAFEAPKLRELYLNAPESH